MRVAFLGLGLIGGSVARALRQGDPAGTGWSLVAWSPTGRGPVEAVEAGVIDEAAPTPQAALDGADLVILAAPPLACVGLLELVGGPWRSHLGGDVTITDVASTKGSLARAAMAAALPYVGGHPMAGREASGFGAADADLFRDRPWVITPASGGGDPGRVRALALACGARPVELDADDHDRLVAAISHLPLLTSVALVEAVAGTGDAAAPGWPEAAALAASGWRDTTRLARGDVTMGTEIAVANAAPIAARLRDYRARIDEWLALLEAPGGPDAPAIKARLAEAKARLDGPG